MILFVLREELQKTVQVKPDDYVSTPTWTIIKTATATMHRVAGLYLIRSEEIYMTWSKGLPAHVAGDADADAEPSALSGDQHLIMNTD